MKKYSKKYSKSVPADHSSAAGGNKPFSPNYFKLLCYLLLAAVIIGIVYVLIFGRDDKTNYLDLFNMALGNTFNSETYRYDSLSTLHIGAEEKIFSTIEGERAGSSNRHIKGDILGTMLELYYIDGHIYRKDSASGSWRVLGKSELADAAMLINELEPVNNFRFNSINQITMAAKEKVNGENCIKLEFSPDLADKWIPRYFKDITYTVWVSVGDPYIIKAVVSATSSENETAGLTIVMNFYDFNSKITLSAPAI